MSQNKDGGPAFPIPVQEDRDCCGRVDSGYGGISIRDYFAAKAMQGCLAYSHCDHNGNWQNNSSAEGVAKFAYEVADAMLKERQR